MSKIDREVIAEWIIEALEKLDYAAHYKLIAKEIWSEHGTKITPNDEIFYTWQYDMRWAAQNLKKRGILLNNSNSDLPKGVWGLVENYNAH